MMRNNKVKITTRSSQAGKLASSGGGGEQPGHYYSRKNSGEMSVDEILDYIIEPGHGKHGDEEEKIEGNSKEKQQISASSNSNTGRNVSSSSDSSSYQDSSVDRAPRDEEAAFEQPATATSPDSDGIELKRKSSDGAGRGNTVKFKGILKTNSVLRKESSDNNTAAANEATGFENEAYEDEEKRSHVASGLENRVDKNAAQHYAADERDIVAKGKAKTVNRASFPTGTRALSPSPLLSTHRSEINNKPFQIQHQVTTWHKVTTCKPRQ